MSESIEQILELSDELEEQERHIKEAELEIKRLHTIIKEVKQYIKEACWLDEVNKPNSLGHKQTMKVLEILDKENK